MVFSSDEFSKRGSILEWGENDVQELFSSLGYPQYQERIKEHRISGDVLCMLDPDALKSVGVQTIGQRLSILKAVYQIKMDQQVPIADDSYVPPSEVSALSGAPHSLEKLNAIVNNQSEKLHNLQEENRFLQHCLQTIYDEVTQMRQHLGLPLDENSPMRRQSPFRWVQYDANRSPTKADALKQEQQQQHGESPHPSPQRGQFEKSKLNQQPRSDSPNRTAEAPPKPLRQESSDNLKSFKVSLDDPTWKVLPAALKKYRINNDNWQNYAMFICYGATGNRTERCLSLDEKPLLLFQRLKDAKKNPVFMLKHIKDIRSPIAVAQQKHAARKASSIISMGNEPPSDAKQSQRPAKLDINDLSESTPHIDGVVGSTALSVPPAWPEGGGLSPMVEQSHDTSIPRISEPSHPRISPSENGYEGGNPPVIREVPVPTGGVSYAVAIYPYMAEQDDEFDVVVGDTFVIISRAKGWWVVQRDQTGFGSVEQDSAKQGWVPAGCLLETNVPVAAAIAEARGTLPVTSPPESPSGKTPILPLSIISTSFPGIALMEYKKKGDEELDLVKDDLLRVFKRYNHWSYAVKEEGGDRGWVPSWYIGKVSSSGPPPPTPSISTPPMSLPTEEPGHPQVSPMSSAFPTVPAKPAVLLS